MTAAEPRPLRLFVGARISLAAVRALDDAVTALREGARSLPSSARPRWVAPASYHITVKFLGWTRPDAVTALRDGIGASLTGARGFELESRGLGAFPSAERARVLWAGVDPAGGARVAELAGKVEAAAERLGFAREKRPYHAHVTLARFREPADVRRLLDGTAEQVYRSSWVDALTLFESKMNSSGSEYFEVASWSFDSGSKGLRRHTAAVERGEPSTLLNHNDELAPPEERQTDEGEDDDGNQY